MEWRQIKQELQIINKIETIQNQNATIYWKVHQNSLKLWKKCQKIMRILNKDHQLKAIQDQKHLFIVQELLLMI